MLCAPGFASDENRLDLSFVDILSEGSRGQDERPRKGTARRLGPYFEK